MHGKLLFIILICFVVTPVSGETIYKWKNENGIICYSNISPPRGIDCQVTEHAAKDRADEILPIGQIPSLEKKAEQKPTAIQTEYPLKRVEERNIVEVDLSSYEEKRELIEQKYTDYRLRLDNAYKTQDRRSIKAVSDEIKKMDREKAQIAKEVKDKTGGFLPEWWHNEGNNVKD